MEIDEFFRDVICVTRKPKSTILAPHLPKSINRLYQWNLILDESILETDICILNPTDTYLVGDYTVFARESQDVVRWGCIGNDDKSKCFVLTDDTSKNAFLENFHFSDLLLGMIVNNTLSTSLLNHYHYDQLDQFSVTAFQHLLTHFRIAGGFSDVNVVVQDKVACVFEGVEGSIQIRAASNSKSSLERFVHQLSGNGQRGYT
jgi:hypothetical protein